MPVLAAVTLPATSGKPEDNVVNTFAFDDDANVPASLDGIALGLSVFYNGDTGEAGTLWTSPGNMLSDAISRTLPVTIKFFDLAGHQDGSGHGSPIRTDDIGPLMPRVGTISGHLPDEIALVLSFHGNVTDVPEAGPTEQVPTPRRAQRMGAPETHLGTTKPRARRRGRIYLGPLIADCGGFESGEYHVMASARNVLATAGNYLMDRTDSTWAVWSRRDSTLRPVVGGHVDNAFDVQRKRGRSSSARTVFGS